MTLRIISKEEAANNKNTVRLMANDGAAAASTGQSDPDSYLSRLTKLFPAEGLALYTGVGSLVAEIEEVEKGPLYFTFALGLGLVAFARWKLTKTESKKSQLIAIGIAVISYILWVLNSDGKLSLGHIFSDYFLYFAIASVAWSIFIPLAYTGTKSN